DERPSHNGPSPAYEASVEQVCSLKGDYNGFNTDLTHAFATPTPTTFTPKTAQQHCVNAKGQRFNLFCAVQILKACHRGFSSAEGRRWERTSYEPENAAKEMNSLTCSQALSKSSMCLYMYHLLYCIVIVCTGLEASTTTASCDVTNPAAMRPCGKVSTFMAVEQRGVSLGGEAAACSRGPAPGSPYPIQLGFVIGSPGLKDRVHHLTRLNACKMSNQRSVWSLRPPRQASLLQAVVAGPRRPLSDDLGSRSLFT
ncbi:hypothetical protein GBF38_005688, partial [Nibea albiflora]